jgi:serine/threonine-protein phosphatase 2B catalytic subunit
MLIAILNTCSKEELEEETPLSPSAEPTSPPPGPETDPNSPEAKRRAIKNKILAIGRLSRVFQVLREESERVTELKTATGGRLPAGTLMLGAEGIKEAINSFEEARKVDLQNERLPPSHEEVEKKDKEAKVEAMSRAVREADNDKELNMVARRISRQVLPFPPRSRLFPTSLLWVIGVDSDRFPPEDRRLMGKTVAQTGTDQPSRPG